MICRTIRGSQPGAISFFCSQYRFIHWPSRARLPGRRRGGGWQHPPSCSLEDRRSSTPAALKSICASCLGHTVITWLGCPPFPSQMSASYLADMYGQFIPTPCFQLLLFNQLGKGITHFTIPQLTTLKAFMTLQTTSTLTLAHCQKVGVSSSHSLTGLGFSAPFLAQFHLQCGYLV